MTSTQKNGQKIGLRNRLRNSLLLPLFLIMGLIVPLHQAPAATKTKKTSVSSNIETLGVNAAIAEKAQAPLVELICL